jgi:hypothetical protein
LRSASFTLWASCSRTACFSWYLPISYSTIRQSNISQAKVGKHNAKKESRSASLRRFILLFG